MIKTLYVLLFAFALNSSGANAQEFEITNLKAVSGKNYLIKYNGFFNDSLQYIDRSYLFDRVPDELKGTTLLMLAGNDKMYEEHELCFSFDVNKEVVVYVLYPVVYPVLPEWLNAYTKTQNMVYRHDSSEETLKGIFNVYSKKFPAGSIAINGCLGKGIKTPKFVEMKGSGYCMYSVLVSELN